MVLVDADAVEPQLLDRGECVDVLAVQLVTLDRIVKGVGQPDPGGIVLLVEVGRQMRPRHQMEEVVLHATASLEVQQTLLMSVAVYRLGTRRPRAASQGGANRYSSRESAPT